MQEIWVVIKFGGTSVSTMGNWCHIVGIIKRHLAANRRVLVVCSAITQVSNKLEHLIVSALSGQHVAVLEDLSAIHQRLSNELGVNFDIHLASHFNRLRQLAEGIALIGEASPRIRAQVMSYGELLLTILGAEYLRSQHLKLDWQDARKLLIAEPDPLVHQSAAYLQARCSADQDDILLNQLNALAPIVLTQGFIASNTEGETVLLGRGALIFSRLFCR